MKIFTKNRIIKLLFLILISSFFVYGYFERRSIKQNRQITTGKVLEISYAAGNGIDQYVFSYQIGDEYYKNTTPKIGNKDIIVGRKFPVVYNGNDYQKSEILILPSDFERFDIPFPDSLNWVKKYDSDSVIELF